SDTTPATSDSQENNGKSDTAANSTTTKENNGQSDTAPATSDSQENNGKSDTTANSITAKDKNGQSDTSSTNGGKQENNGKSDTVNNNDSGKKNERLDISGRGSQQYILENVNDAVTVNNVPASFTLLDQNFPNPFNPSTTITFTLSSRNHVRLDVFAINGQRVAQIIDDTLDKGAYAFTWKPQRTLGSGTYLYRLSTPDVSFSRRMILLK
ncbi:MAG: T9SS type A sorting domain-containing protein, partial [Candidatus Latescibacterota bacterium]